MPLRVSSVCLAVLLVLAGCSGSPPPDAASTTTADPTAGTAATAESPTTRDASTASTTTLPTRATLSAADLSASERDLLRRAVENESVRVTRSNLTGELTPDTDGWYARYRGTLYELSWERGGFYGEYHLGNATVVNASSVESSDGVVAYENLTADARELFEAARAKEDVEGYGAEAFPDQLRSNRYVTYEGEYYELRLAVADYVAYRLSVEDVES
ncbi:hypothetical protein [Halorussus sp. MSC15.2]|uniref:hypothetical protein n=1 Tax=Halorussus sp. MSC15.2 TaxID=2283638 RepID=UPI0013D122B0|nr:hypothetical protein [Halorussus sp. MSC15.2]NEU55545.1 hypothetical protein [Halorussus sp. MSC15.2]